MNALLVSINWLKFHTIMIVLVAIFVYAGILMIGLEFIDDLSVDHPFIGVFLLLVWFVLLVAPIVFVFSLKA
uniref:hypothetical protein n=1 Tax=Lactobacillus acidophilus TaxID=1579 RepID=UPI003F554E17